MGLRRGCVRWATSPGRPRCGACQMCFPGPVTSRGSQVGPVAALPPARLRRRDAQGWQRGRRPRDLRVVSHWLMVRGGRPHALRPALVLQVPFQVGQRSMPRRFRFPPCPVDQHAVLLVGPLPCYVSLLVVVFLSAVGAPAFPPWRPPWSPRVVAGLAVRGAWLRRPSVAPPLGRGLPTRAAARAGFSGLRTAGRQPGRWCVPGLGWDPGWGAGDREMTVLWAAPPAGLSGACCRWDAGSACAGACRWSAGAVVLGVAGAWELGLSVG